MQPYVSVQAARKIYAAPRGAIEAVGSATMDVEPGSFVSILGPSGCGKSTLLMMLAGLESLSGGRITIGGAEVTGPRTDFGLIFQDPTLLPWKSVMENVLFPIRILKHPVADFRDRAEELLERVGLLAFRDKRPRELSGGMRQRVAICRALIHDPYLLLMDEPFSALDAITRDDMNVVLRNIWEAYDKTGIFITHSIREAVYLSDRVLVMTHRPSTIVFDVAVPFPRPRDLAIQETPEFNEICALLRSKIEQGYRQQRDA